MKKRLRLRIQMFLLVTGVYAVVALLSLLFFWALTPQQYFVYYPSIDLFYWVCGMVMTYYLDRCRRACQPEKLLNVFLTFRSIKLVLSLAILFVGMRLLDLPRAAFAITLMGNFIIYSMLEIYIYYRFNKRMSGNKDKKWVKKA